MRAPSNQIIYGILRDWVGFFQTRFDCICRECSCSSNICNTIFCSEILAVHEHVFCFDLNRNDIQDLSQLRFCFTIMLILAKPGLPTLCTLLPPSVRKVHFILLLLPRGRRQGKGKGAKPTPRGKTVASHNLPTLLPAFREAC